MTCWRRLRDWHKAGVWRRLHEVLLAELNGAEKIDWSRASVDSRSFRALGGGEKTGPSPVDRRRKGSKQPIIVDAKGTPLAVTVTAANVPDVKQLEALIEAIPPVRGERGRPRRRPKEVYADRGYDSEPHRQRMRRRGIHPTADRAAEDAARERPGQIPMGRGADAVVAAAKAQAPYPHRTSRRHS
jgi:transposase